MKKASKKVRGSLVGLLLRAYIFFSFVFLTVGGGLLVYAVFSLTFPSYTNLSYYKKELQSETFQDISAKKLLGKGGRFQVYDASGDLLYKSYPKDSLLLTKRELPLIANTNTDYTVDVVSDCTVFKNQDGQIQYLIKREKTVFKPSKFLGLWLPLFVEISEAQTEGDYLLLDKDYRLLSTTLPNPQPVYSKREFRLLTDQSVDGFYLQKYLFKTADRKSRILVLLFPSGGSYNAQELANSRLVLLSSFLILVSIYVLLALFFAFWLRRKVNIPLRLLNQAITGLSDREQQGHLDYSGPKEFVDIMENFNHTAAELRASQLAREQSEADRRRDLAAISHDLKTPITVIQGYAKALSDGLVPEAKQQSYLSVIDSKAAVLNDLINSFHDYSKVAHPNFVLKKEKVDICVYLRKYLAKAAAEFDLSGYRLNADLPQRPVYLFLDIERLERILDNLFSNFTAYNPKGSTLFLTFFLHENEAELTIADNGIGISESQAENLFQPFITGDASRSASSGSGLGLTIAKELMQAHGGEIYLQFPPAPPYRTQFILTFPLSD